MCEHCSDSYIAVACSYISSICRQTFPNAVIKIVKKDGKGGEEEEEENDQDKNDKRR